MIVIIVVSTSIVEVDVGIVILALIVVVVDVVGLVGMDIIGLRAIVGEVSPITPKAWLRCGLCDLGCHFHLIELFVKLRHLR